MPTPPIIQVEGLSHVYSRGTPFEKTALENVSLSVEAGALVGVIGHTGSGKSTFVQHLDGLLVPTAGRVLIGGEDIAASKDALRRARFRVGLVFQYPEYQLFEETVYKDISFGPRNMELSEDDIDARVREAAGFVGVGEELFSQSPIDLSGGQKRRVAIAGVMAMHPEVLVLDEPTAGLDPRGREQLLANVLDYRAATGATVLLVTHSMDEIARIATRLVVFSEGRLAMDGTPEQVFSRAAELREMGLAVPKATEIALELKSLGIAVPDGIYTIDCLREALLRLERGSGDA
ncbi:MAG: energy-coupling factor transporter ATPase [Oscillospiraceae bacterium]|nr:energy-coupling factor transporter ATPase [Oscillospiraceae bacterium]